MSAALFAHKSNFMGGKISLSGASTDKMIAFIMGGGNAH